MKETPEALLADMKAHVARLSDDDIVLEPAFCMVIFHEMECGWLGAAHVNVEALNRGSAN